MGEVRVCTPPDWVKFMDIGGGENLFRNMHPGKKLDKQLFKKFWGSLMDANKGALFVEVDDNEVIVGILGVVVGVDFWNGDLHANILCWHSTGRNRVKLFLAARDFAKKRKCKELIAHSMLNHDRMEKFYGHRGLTPMAREYVGGL